MSDCVVNDFSSRVCELGTKGCTVTHDGLQVCLAEKAYLYKRLAEADLLKHSELLKEVRKLVTDDINTIEKLTGRKLTPPYSGGSVCYYCILPKKACVVCIQNRECELYGK